MGLVPTMALMSLMALTSPTGLTAAYASTTATHSTKLSLLRIIPMAFQALLALRRSMLALRNNTTMLVHYKIFLLKTRSSIRLISCSMPNLSSGPSKKCISLSIDMIHAIRFLVMPFCHYEIRREKNSKD